MHLPTTPSSSTSSPRTSQLIATFNRMDVLSLNPLNFTDLQRISICNKLFRLNGPVPTTHVHLHTSRIYVWEKVRISRVTFDFVKQKGVTRKKAFLSFAKAISQFVNRRTHNKETIVHFFTRIIEAFFCSDHWTIRNNFGMPFRSVVRLALFFASLKCKEHRQTHPPSRPDYNYMSQGYGNGNWDVLSFSLSRGRQAKHRLKTTKEMSLNWKWKWRCALAGFALLVLFFAHRNCTTCLGKTSLKLAVALPLTPSGKKVRWVCTSFLAGEASWFF